MVQKSGRLYVRIDPIVLARAKSAADKLGLDLTAYVTLALSERIRRDEQEDAKASQASKKGR